MTFQKTVPAGATTSVKERPDTAQIIITNPLKQDIFVNAILLSFNAFFSQFGKMEIKINQITKLSPENQDFSQRKSYSVPLNNQPLRRGETIEIFIWNPDIQSSDSIKISAQISISELSSSDVLNPDSLTTEELQNQISDSFVDKSIQFLEASLLGKLSDVITSVDDENTDLQAKIQALINVLPDSPDNAGLLAALNGIITSVDDENTDLQAKIQALINSLPDSPDNANIIAELQAIVDSVDSISLDFVTLISLLAEIQTAIDNSTSGAYLTALNTIKSSLNGLKNGFDIDELTDTIDTLITNLVTIRSNNSVLGDNVDLFKVSLEQVMTASKLNKSKKGILIPKQIYYNSSTPVLFNTKGYKNIIITMAGSTIPDLVSVSDIVKTLNVGTLYLGNTSKTLHSHQSPLSSNIYSNFSGLVSPSIFSIYGYQATACSKLIETEISSTVYDFLTTDYHILQFNFLANSLSDISNSEQQLNPPSGNSGHKVRNYLRKKYFIRIEESGSSNSGFTLVRNYGAAEGDGAKTYLTISKRYVKILVKVKVYIHIERRYHALSAATVTRTFSALSQTVNGSLMFSDIINGKTKNGTAYLSIEIKDAFGEWFTLVTATELGTITEGTKTIKSFGEALGNKALPATQDSLRFVLKVTGGGIETGVSIMRVA